MVKLAGHHPSSVRTTTKRFQISGFKLFLIIAITLVIGMLAGAKRYDIFAAVSPIIGINYSSDRLETDNLQQTYQALNANFDGKLDKRLLQEGAARGMVQAAGDDYTIYMNAKDAAEFDSDLSGSIGGGIGAQIGLRNDKITLVKILADTPAEQAGLQKGDEILKVNDQSTAGFTVEQAVAKLRGEIGSTVKIELYRAKNIETVSITRAEITAPSVTSEVKHDIGVLTISRFDKNTARLARQAAQEFKQKRVKGVILDLRANPGGFIDSARDVAGLWLNEKLIVKERVGDKVIDELKSGRSAVFNDMKTVVLIDGSSASASEIVAGALQDYKVATIIGETSFGKGSVQRLIPLVDGSVLKVTVARWYTPNGRNISKNGIKPDIEVKPAASSQSKDQDVQLDRAIEYFK